MRHLGIGYLILISEYWKVVLDQSKWPSILVDKDALENKVPDKYFLWSKDWKKSFSLDSFSCYWFQNVRALPVSHCDFKLWSYDYM